MRIAAFVNGTHLCTAGLSGKGYLGAHLNLALRETEDASERLLRLTGIETRETESTYVDWPSAALKPGDEVTLQLLETGETTEPTSVRPGSAAPTNLLSSEQLAADLLSSCSDFEARLHDVLAKAKANESAAEYEKLLRAIGEISAALGETLLYPVYRRHASLVPEQLRGEIL